jgi:hypothetical protein
VRHRAGLVPDSRIALTRRDDVWVDDQQVVYRDTAGSLRARSLVDGHTLATARSAGRILCANGDRVVLLRTEPPASISTLESPRRIVIVDLHAGTEVASAPLPLPAWVVTTSEGEPAETLVAWFEDADVLIAWQAALGWRGGVAPPSEEAARVRRASGSLRIDPSGRFISGGEIAFPQARPSRSPIRARSYLRQLEAGDGVFWLEDVDPHTSAVSHSFVEADGTTRNVTWSSRGPRGIADVGGLWVRSDRLVVLRHFISSETPYAVPRAIDVLDRRTGRSLWHDDVAVMHTLPPRP